MQATSNDFFRVSYFYAGETPAVTVLRQHNGKVRGGAHPRPTQASMGRLWRLIYGACYLRGIGRIEPWLTAPGWSWEWESEEEADDEDH